MIARARKKSAAQLDREITDALKATPRGRGRGHASMGESFRVAYLVPNPRRGEPGQETMLRLWYAGESVQQSMDQALADLRAARRRGYTAWLTDASGKHVPVKGAMRPYTGSFSEY